MTGARAEEVRFQSAHFYRIGCEMKKKYKTRVWRPFRKEDYKAEWRSKYFIGVLQELGRDLRRCHERIWRGYCDHDIFSIDYWFLGLMPTMLEDFKDHLHGCPVAPDYPSHAVFLDEKEKSNEAMKEWQGVLDRMIFLMKEAGEETCSRKNPYEDDFDQINEEFQERYGAFGEKLCTEKEKVDSKSGRGTVWHMAHEIPEYKPTWDNYMKEESRLAQYRQECKDEALALFSKWFYSLWD